MGHDMTIVRQAKVAAAATLGHALRTSEEARVAHAVAVAVADDADLHEGAAPDHRDGVGIVVAEVEVLHAGGAITHKTSSTLACACAAFKDLGT